MATNLGKKTNSEPKWQRITKGILWLLLWVVEVVVMTAVFKLFITGDDPLTYIVGIILAVGVFVIMLASG